MFRFLPLCNVHVNCERQQHQYQSSKGLSPNNLENQNEDQIRSNLERGDEGVGNVSPHSTSPSELTSVLPWEPEGDKRLRCITLSLFFLLLLIFSLSNFSPLLLLVNCFLLHALQGRPSRFDFRDVATPALPSPLVLQSTCVSDASLCSSSQTTFHAHHIHLGKVAFDFVPGPLHPKKAPRRLRALSAGNSSSGALKSYIRHTSSAVAGTLTGRCKSHKDSLQDRAHINQQEEAAKILHSVVWEQPHGHLWLGTQSMGSHAYLPPKSSVDQGSGRRTDT